MKIINKEIMQEIKNIIDNDTDEYAGLLEAKKTQQFQRRLANLFLK